MAEQSVGMSTGSGDGVAGGYPNTRMTGKDADTIGSGILLKSPYFALSGAGTSVLTIGAGSILNNGYFYQNTSDLTINVSSGVITAAYYLVCRVNDTGTAETVTRSATGTTIPARSVRLCLVTIASYAAGRDVILATVNVSGGVVSGYSNIGVGFIAGDTVLQSNFLSKSILGVMNKTTAQTIPANTLTYLTYDTITNSSFGIIYGTAGSSTLTLGVAGNYQIWGYVRYASGSTGIRMISIPNAGLADSVLLSNITPPAGGVITQNFNATVYSRGDLQISVAVTASVSGELVTQSYITITRI